MYEVVAYATRLAGVTDAVIEPNDAVIVIVPVKVSTL